MGTIERGQKSKPQKIPGPKINPPQKSHAEFLNLKNSHEKEKQVWLYMYFIRRNMRLVYMGTTMSLKRYNATRACPIEMTFSIKLNQ